MILQDINGLIMQSYKLLRQFALQLGYQTYRSSHLILTMRIIIRYPSHLNLKFCSYFQSQFSHVYIIKRTWFNYMRIDCKV